MKYFRDKNNQVYAYELDGSQDNYIKSDLILMTDDEVYAHLNPVLTSEQKKALRIEELKQLLKDTDYVALSDYDKNKIDVIAQRQAWRNELRTLE
jgi:hypothetical protein